MNIIEKLLNFVTNNKEWISENKNTIVFICFLIALCFILCLIYKFYKSNTSNIVNNINENNKSISIKNNKGNITIDNSDKIIKNFRIDYSKFIDLTLGASGLILQAPDRGVFYIKGIRGSFCINNKIEEPILFEGKQINVEKNEYILIKYNERENNVIFRFYYFKEVND